MNGCAGTGRCSGRWRRARRWAARRPSRRLTPDWGGSLMTCRVQLVSPATSPSLREARFYDGEAIDGAGRARARAVGADLTAAQRAVVSPSERCEETAVALGLGGERVPQLDGLDVGRWRGRTLEEVAAHEPEAVARWLGDPAAAPHGGESVQDLCARVASLAGGPGGHGRPHVGRRRAGDRAGGGRPCDRHACRRLLAARRPTADRHRAQRTGRTLESAAGTAAHRAVMREGLRWFGGPLAIRGQRAVGAVRPALSVAGFGLSSR